MSPPPNPKKHVSKKQPHKLLAPSHQQLCTGCAQRPQMGAMIRGVLRFGAPYREAFGTGMVAGPWLTTDAWRIIPVSKPLKTKMNGRKSPFFNSRITMFNRKYIFIHGGFSIVMSVFGGCSKLATLAYKALKRPFGMGSHNLNFTNWDDPPSTSTKKKVVAIKNCVGFFLSNEKHVRIG